MSFYEIRLESIGGLGAHLAGQMLAEAGVLGMNLNGAHFSSYGSEKKGSPVKSYVRLGLPDRAIRSTSPAREPDLVAVFHEALLADPGVLSGLRPGATLIVNTPRPAAEVASQVALPGVLVIAVDAIEIAVQEKTRVNTAMLGAIVQAVPLLEPEPVQAVLRTTFGRKYPQLVAANLRTFERGATETTRHTLSEEAAQAHGAQTPAPAAVGSGPVVGWRTQPIGGILATSGNTMLKDISASRQGFLPVFHAELCVHCAICDLVCPDFCFTWVPDGRTVGGFAALKLEGIDYQYCKGCMHCVTECPTGALTKEREIGDIAERLRVPLNLAAPAVPAGAGEGR